MSKRKSHAAKPSQKKEIQDVADAVSASPEPSAAASNADSARERMIAEAAYYRAQRRGFAPGNELDDWLAAEIEITSSALEEQPPAAELH